MSAHIRLLDGNRLAGLIEAYQTLDWARPYLGSGSFTLTLGRAAADAAGIALGLLVEPPGEPGLVYVIEQIERNHDTPEEVIVSGRDFGGCLLERDCVPPAGQMHHTLSGISPEAAMKAYVNANAGSGAATARRIPGLVTGTNQDRPAGVTGTYKARYQYVGELLAEIGAVAGLGWEIRLDYATGLFVFDVLPGVNRATLPGGDRVFFDPEFQTARSQQWITGNLGHKNVARVLGQGEGAARLVAVTWLGQALGAPEPVGVERRELVIDARDLEATPELLNRGLAKLTEALAVDSFDVAVDPNGSFRYQRDWDLGDLVVVRNSAWGLQKTGRIVAVKSRVDSGTGRGPQITIEIGRPLPTLRDILGGELGTGSARD